MNSHCGNDSVCQTFTCSAAGVCITNNVPNGTAIASGMQTTGDCKTIVCNGAGVTTTAVNNSDVPVDGITCTQDLCNAGNPVNPSAPAGTACSQTNGIKCDGNGACVACLAPADCGTTTFCKTFSCSAAGTCSSTNKANGTPLPSQDQITGNCQTAVCMSGATGSINDDTDVDVDGNMCTNDTCSNGTPQNPILPLGTPCGAAQMCNASGVCVGCNVDADCGAPANECQTPVCNQGTCTVTFANQGTVLSMSMQTAGDCHQNVCDATGGVVDAIDDNDKPSTGGNMCLQSVCNAGVPTLPPFAAGTTCTGPNNANQCNGTGACVECLTAITCPGGPDTTCHNRVCNAGFCDIAFAAAGTVDTVQSAMPDCKQNQCDDAGNSNPVPFDMDVPAPTACATPSCRVAQCCPATSRTERVYGTAAPATPAPASRRSACSGERQHRHQPSLAIEERLLDGTLVSRRICPSRRWRAATRRSPSMGTRPRRVRSRCPETAST